MSVPDTTASRNSLLPTWLARALIAASCITVVEGIIAASPHAGSVRVAAWLGAILFLGTFPVAYVRPDRVLMALSAAGVVIMSFTVPGNAPFVAAVATIAVSGLQLPVEYARRISAVAGIGFVAGVAVTSHFSARNIVSPVAGLLFTYIAADALRRLREEQRRTQSLLQEVIAGRDDRIRAAALDERARLAREMHDVLAHTLSALSIQLEGARMLAEQQPGDAAVMERIERAGRLAREGMEEARRAVGSLRGDSLPGPDLLPALAEDFERDTGIPTHLEVEGTVRDLSPDGRLAMYRVAQEALTNVRKHAAATSVDLTLRYQPEGTELTVENDGEERASSMGGGGFGLNGMRERAELLGGRLEAGPTEAGFRVSVWIPA